LFAVFLFLLSFWLASPLLADEGDPPSRVVRLSVMDGAVSFEPAGENDWVQASLNYPLTNGDRLWTDKNARAELETGNLAIRLSSETDLTTTNVSDQLVQLGLAQGVVRVRAFDLLEGHEVEVDTPNAALTVRRSGNYRFEVYPDQNTTLVVVNSGEVEISGGGEVQTVSSGHAVRLSGTNPAQVEMVEAPGTDDFDRWCSDRDRRYAAATTRRYVSPETPGYYDLDQYGSWDAVAEYGPVWYPSGIAVGWAPYRFGRWAWVEPWGWTWVDDAPWGFAPFHYGRWVLVGARWGWLPGPIVVAPVYGPAFVAFLGGGGFSVGFAVGGVAAWCPLGPGEPFYPWYHHSDVYLRQVNVTNIRNVTNITNITNVTNVNNIHYRYQTVAATAVPVNTFRSAQPVARSMVRLSPQQLASARAVPHPDVTPDVHAITAGAPPAHAVAPRPRPLVVQHQPTPSARPGQPVANSRPVAPANERPAPNEPKTPANERPAPNEAKTPANERSATNVPRPPSENRTPPASEARTVPPETRPAPERASTPVEPNKPNVARPSEPAATNRAPQENRGAPPPNRPALVTRTAPPPESVPFAQRQPAMQEHPGRPLEPQQRVNVQQGRPPGPMVDREVPPHAAPVAHSAPPPSHPAESHSSGKPKP
jgi:hypothetical protein